MVELPVLERAIATWPQWGLTAAPRLLGPLAGGATNAGYLLATARGRLVLRINAADGERLGIDREREQRILRRIEASGIAPKLRFCDPARGFLVTEYVEGRHWQPGPEMDDARWARLLALMDRVHAVVDGVPRFDHAAHARRYWWHLSRAPAVDVTVAAAYARVCARLDRFQRSMSSPVLCHHDPSPRNVIETIDGDLLLLDWEYAGAGAAVIDRAALGRAWAMPTALVREHTAPVQRRWLDFAGDLMDFYDRAWCALRGLPITAP